MLRVASIYDRYLILRNVEEDSFRELMRGAASMGISIDNFYMMDMKMYTDYRYGIMKHREDEFNNTQNLLHLIAGKVGQAVNCRREFNNKLDKVDWSSDILEDHEERETYKRQQEMADRIMRQYGIDIFDNNKELTDVKTTDGGNEDA